MLHFAIDKGILGINMTSMRLMLRWDLLIAVTAAVTVPLTRVGVPSAALFAALVVGVVLALTSLAPSRIPRKAGVAAQGVLGVYIGTMVHQDAVGALLLSVVAGALLGLHRDLTPLTGSLALVAGGASGLVAIARELGGDDRVVSVVQYLRVALVTASMPVLVGATVGNWIRLPGAGLLGPMALTVVLQLTGLSFGLAVPMVLVQVGYMVIGWQAGLAFTSDSLRAIGRMLPAAIGLIVALGVATAGLGALLARFTGLTPLEGYLATSPGGVYAVLATAVETGSNVTFIIAAQVVRILLMLFAAPLMARSVVWMSKRFGRQTRAIIAPSREPIRAAD